MINEETFWDIIERSIQEKESIDKNQQGDSLLDILKEHPVQDIVSFHKRVIKLRERINSDFMREIAFMLKFGNNNHAYEGFLNWVIALGKAHYQRAQKSPAYLLTLDDPNLFIVGQAYFPDLSLTGVGSYIEKTDKAITDWQDELHKS